MGVTFCSLALSDSSMASLSPLVDLARSGDREAFEELVRITSPDTYTLARRLCGNADDAADVVQEAYLRAYRSIRKFRGDAAFTTWLYRITANCAADQLNRRSRHRHDDLDDEQVDERAEIDPESHSANVELRDQLKAALDGLPPKLRAVVVLRDIYDLPHEEIAAQLKISESAAKVRLHRARRKLREELYPLPGEEESHAV